MRRCLSHRGVIHKIARRILVLVHLELVNALCSKHNAVVLDGVSRLWCLKHERYQSHCLSTNLLNEDTPAKLFLDHFNT